LTDFVAPRDRAREVIRSPERRTPAVPNSPTAGDLYEHDEYARTLLASLMRAQLAVTLSILIPAAALLSLYPLLAVLFPALARAHLAGIPVTLLILGGGIYPPLVLLGFWYVRRTERVDQRFVDLLDGND
jgi:Flp pilus assembly protein TadB